MKRVYGLSIPQTLEEVCNPERIALLVYDMQVGILTQLKNGNDITRQVLRKALRHSARINLGRTQGKIVSERFLRR